MMLKVFLWRPDRVWTPKRGVFQTVFQTTTHVSTIPQKPAFETCRWLEPCSQLVATFPLLEKAEIAFR